MSSDTATARLVRGGKVGAMLLDSARLDLLAAQAGALNALIATDVISLAASGGEPVEWALAQRQDYLKMATLLVHLLVLDIACYPLSTAAVVFYGEPSCP